MALSSEELERYSQQIKLAELGLAGQLQLKAARVLCVGAGGLAAPLLMYLAGAGVGTLGVIDNDEVELSNLQRQIIYGAQHLGSKKAEIAQNVLHKLNPNVQLHAYVRRLTLVNAEELLAQYDIVADCTDNFATRYLINDLCYHLNKPFVSASVDRFQGQCTTFLAKQGPCYRCLFPHIPPAELIPNCEEGGVLGVLPGMMGMLQATETLKWILNLGSSLSGRLLKFDAMMMSFREFKFKQNPNCELCVQHKTAEELLIASSCDLSLIISAAELKSRLQKQDFLLLDVRSIDEHQEQNLGGHLIPLDELSNRLTEIDKNQEIIIYCRSGRRSAIAAKLLRDAGYPLVKHLVGGIMAFSSRTPSCALYASS